MNIKITKETEEFYIKIKHSDQLKNNDASTLNEYVLGEMLMPNVLQICMLFQLYDTNNGCKAIDPLYAGINDNILKIQKQEHLSILSPMPMKTEDPEEVVNWYSFINSTMDVKPLTIHYASYATSIWRIGKRKHLPSDETRNIRKNQRVSSHH